MNKNIVGLHLENHWILDDDWYHGPMDEHCSSSPATLFELLEPPAGWKKPLQDSHTWLFLKTDSNYQCISFMHFVNCSFLKGPMAQIDHDSWLLMFGDAAMQALLEKSVTPCQLIGPKSHNDVSIPPNKIPGSCKMSLVISLVQLSITGSVSGTRTCLVYYHHHHQHSRIKAVTPSWTQQQ